MINSPYPCQRCGGMVVPLGYVGDVVGYQCCCREWGRWPPPGYNPKPKILPTTPTRNPPGSDIAERRYMTEDDVRRIVREELEKSKETDRG